MSESMGFSGTWARRLGAGLAILLGALLASGCDREAAPQGPVEAQVMGTIVLAPGEFVPVGMPLEVELVRHPAAPQGEGALAVTRFGAGASTETPFALEYDVGRLEPGAAYVLRARAILDSTVYLTGEAPVPSPSAQPPIPVDIVLRRRTDGAPLFREVSILRLGHKREEDWARLLRDVMPAIQLCLRSVSGQDLEVTKAWPMGAGEAGVRIRGADGGGFDCVALMDGSKFTSLTGLPSFSEALPGERSPVFIPAPRGPEAMACRRYERVVGGFNEPLGWLVYPTCPGSETPAPDPAR